MEKFPGDTPTPKGHGEAGKDDQGTVLGAVGRDAQSSSSSSAAFAGGGDEFLPGLQEADAGDTANDVAHAAGPVEHAKDDAGVKGLVPGGRLPLELLADAAEGGAVPAGEEAKHHAEEGQGGHRPTPSRQAPEQPDAQGRGDAGQGRRGGRGQRAEPVVAQIAEKGTRQDTGNVEQGEQQRGRGRGESGFLVGVTVDIGLGDAVTRRLEDRGDDVNVERPVGEKVPRRAAGSMMTSLCR